MITPEVAQMVAADRAAQLQRAAASARLAAIARCCRPSHWAQAASRVVRAMSRLQRERVPAGVCCAGA
ncbi:hypothetical protein [Modestobacter marinus]|jgi:hypothetical protein|uniref:hypothetical protein n=1 Tax=Modestobacter marinus TaxID=477641 RepID=UPI001C95A5CE|nr:hypothetical protein [Modestobacter marinus]